MAESIPRKGSVARQIMISTRSRTASSRARASASQPLQPSVTGQLAVERRGSTASPARTRPWRRPREQRAAFARPRRRAPVGGPAGRPPAAASRCARPAPASSRRHERVKNRQVAECQVAMRRPLPPLPAPNGWSADAVANGCPNLGQRQASAEPNGPGGARRRETSHADQGDQVLRILHPGIVGDGRSIVNAFPTVNWSFILDRHSGKGLALPESCHGFPRAIPCPCGRAGNRVGN